MFLVLLKERLLTHLYSIIPMKYSPDFIVMILLLTFLTASVVNCYHDITSYSLKGKCHVFNPSYKLTHCIIKGVKDPNYANTQLGQHTKLNSKCEDFTIECNFNGALRMRFLFDSFQGKLYDTCQLGDLTKACPVGYDKEKTIKVSLHNTNRLEHAILITTVVLISSSSLSLITVGICTLVACFKGRDLKSE